MRACADLEASPLYDLVERLPEIGAAARTLFDIRIVDAIGQVDRVQVQFHPVLALEVEEFRETHVELMEWVAAPPSFQPGGLGPKMWNGVPEP